MFTIHPLVVGVGVPTQHPIPLAVGLPAHRCPRCPLLGAGFRVGLKSPPFGSSCRRWVLILNALLLTLALLSTPSPSSRPSPLSRYPTLIFTSTRDFTVSGGSRFSSPSPIVVLVAHPLRCRSLSSSSVGLGATSVRPRCADIGRVVVSLLLCWRSAPTNRCGE